MLNQPSSQCQNNHLKFILQDSPSNMEESKDLFQPKGVNIQNETVLETHGVDVYRESGEYSAINVVHSADANV